MLSKMMFSSVLAYGVFMDGREPSTKTASNSGARCLFSLDPQGLEKDENVLHARIRHLHPHQGQSLSMQGGMQKVGSGRRRHV